MAQLSILILLLSAVLLSSLPLLSQGVTASTSNARRLQGRAVCTDTPSDTNVLAWNSSSGCWKPSVGAGSGGTINYGTLASRPSCSTTNNLYIASDSIYQSYVCNSSSWVPLLFNIPATEPVLGNYTWQNQGTSTTSTAAGGIYVTYQVGAAFRSLVKSAPSTPYTVYAASIPHFVNASNGNGRLCPVLFRESGTNKIVSIGVQAGTAGFVVDKWTNDTTFSATSYSSVTPGSYDAPFYVVKAVADGTNIAFSISTDGKNFYQVFSEAKGTFFTSAPNQIGFGAWCDSTGTSSQTLYHWSEQ